MERWARRRLEAEASATDPYDGIVCLANDADSFGFGLAQISMTLSLNLTRMTHEAEPSVDCAVVTRRFSRHPAPAEHSVADVPQGQSPAARRASMQTSEWMRP